MIKSSKIKLIAALLIAPLLCFSSFTTIPALAAGNNSDSICGNTNIPKDIRDASGCEDTGDQLPSVIINILNGVIAVSGLIAVIFVIVGGVHYMTSAGDPGKTKKAKDTILYALIGLIICVLAFAIVNFVIVNVIGDGSTSTSRAGTAGAEAGLQTGTGQ